MVQSLTYVTMKFQEQVHMHIPMYVIYLRTYICVWMNVNFNVISNVQMFNAYTVSG